MKKKIKFNKHNLVSIIEKKNRTKHISFDTRLECDNSDHFTMFCTSKSHAEPVKMSIVEVQTDNSSGIYCTYIYGICDICRKYDSSITGKRKIYWS